MKRETVEHTIEFTEDLTLGICENSELKMINVAAGDRAIGYVWSRSQNIGGNFMEIADLEINQIGHVKSLPCRTFRFIDLGEQPC